MVQTSKILKPRFIEKRLRTLQAYIAARSPLLSIKWTMPETPSSLKLWPRQLWQTNGSDAAFAVAPDAWVAIYGN